MRPPIWAIWLQMQTIRPTLNLPRAGRWEGVGGGGGGHRRLGARIARRKVTYDAPSYLDFFGSPREFEILIMNHICCVGCVKSPASVCSHRETPAPHCAASPLGAPDSERQSQRAAMGISQA